MPKRKVGIFGVKKSRYLGPFARHSDDLPSESDSSDSDYSPAEDSVGSAKASRKKKSRITTELGDTLDGIKNKTEACSLPKPTGVKTSDIPIETVVKIFDYLLFDEEGIRHICRAGMVCRQWSIAAQCPLLWKTVNLAFLAKSRTARDCTVLNLVKRFPCIEELNLNGWKKLTDASINEIANRLPKLRALSIGYCVDTNTGKRKIKTESLKDLVQKIPFQKVDFSGVLSQASVLKILVEKSKEEITHISLADCKCVGSGQLSLIQSSCNQLKALDLSKTSLESIHIERLQAGCPNLEELYLTNLTLVPSRVPADNTGLVEGFPKLKALSLGTVYGGQGITNCFLKRILHASRELKVLDLRGCINVSIRGLLDDKSSFLLLTEPREVWRIMKYFSRRHRLHRLLALLYDLARNITCQEMDLPTMSVERLFMGRCKVDRDMLYGISHMWHSSLLELDLSRTSLNDILPNESGCTIEFHRLKVLDLTGTQVSDYDVSYLLDRCPSLVSLDLSLCRSISRGLKTIHNGKDTMKLRRTLVDWKSQ